MKELYIIGAGGLGRETAWLAERINRERQTWEIRGFIDDNESLWGTVCGGYPILEGLVYLKELVHEVWCVCAVGNAAVRKKIIESLGGADHIHFATLIDPGADISERVSVGEGSIICAGNIITVDICIGRHNIINPDCTIGHDAVLDDFVTLYTSVNVSGQVKIGECAEIGTGANIIQGKKIGDRTVIGAGAVVIKDIGSDCTAVGCPARVVEYHANESGGVNSDTHSSAVKLYQTKRLCAALLRGAA